MPNPLDKRRSAPSTVVRCNAKFPAKRTEDRSLAEMSGAALDDPLANLEGRLLLHASRTAPAPASASSAPLHRLIAASLPAVTRAFANWLANWARIAPRGVTPPAAFGRLRETIRPHVASALALRIVLESVMRGDHTLAALAHEIERPSMRGLNRLNLGANPHRSELGSRSLKSSPPRPDGFTRNTTRAIATRPTPSALGGASRVRLWF
jgi:hypothetical protein